MTTSSHAMLALAVAIPVESYAWPVKVIALVSLAISHLPTDMLPHYHLYDFGRLNKTWRGAIIELSCGLVLVPLIVWQLVHIDPWWLVACVVAASLFDFLVVAKIALVIKLNHWAHQWERNGWMPDSDKIRYEIVQLFALFSLLFVVIVWYRH